MTLPPAVLLGLVLIIGFLSGSTIYFFNKSHFGNNNPKVGSKSFQADLPQISPSALNQKIDSLTAPAEPKGRLSFPANVYTVQSKETLFGIGVKFGVDWQLIKLANGVTNENLIQAGYALAIPRLDPSSDLYRLKFKLNEDMAAGMNRDLRDKIDDPAFNPIEVSKKSAAPYFGIKAEDEFSLLEQNESNGTALVRVKDGVSTNVVGLYQPKIKGKNGFWAILYIEHRS